MSFSKYLGKTQFQYKLLKIPTHDKYNLKNKFFLLRILEYDSIPK